MLQQKLTIAVKDLITEKLGIFVKKLFNEISELNKHNKH